MSIKFWHIINEHQNTQSAFELLFFLSKKIKNLEEYFKYREDEIDFCLSEFNENIEKIKQNIPIERITKQLFFCNRQFHIEPNVFISRHETELLPDLINQYIKEFKIKNFSYIDICSGCGTIGITMFLENKDNIKKFSLLDISQLATKNIEKNLKKFNLSGNVINADWYEYLNQNQYEVITANFPYISYSDKLDENILKNDPKLALFGNKEGWEHYEKLLLFVQNNPYWKLIGCECNEFHWSKWKNIISSNLYKKIKFIECFDLNNKFRFMVLLNLNNIFP